MVVGSDGWTREDADNLAHIARSQMAIAAATRDAATAIRDIADVMMASEASRPGGLELDPDQRCPGCSSTRKPIVDKFMGGAEMRMCAECGHEWRIEPA